MENDLQKSDLQQLRISAAKLVTAIFILVYVVRNCGLIRLCHQNQHDQYYYCNRMHSRFIAFQNYILELSLVFVSVITVLNNLTGLQLLTERKYRICAKFHKCLKHLACCSTSCVLNGNHKGICLLPSRSLIKDGQRFDILRIYDPFNTKPKVWTHIIT